MKTITLYTPEELKKENPEGFERAHEWYKSTNDEIPWSDEIIASLKAVFKASGIHLFDWSISTYDHSYVKFEMESDVQELTGQRALAWIENNLLADLRERRTFINRVKKYETWHDFTKYGEIPSCPFTGVCFDEDMIESLLNSIKSGDTLGEAYHSLADTAGELFEGEMEQAQSEEEFLLQEHLTFTFEGRYV